MGLVLNKNAHPLNFDLKLMYTHFYYLLKRCNDLSISLLIHSRFRTVPQTAQTEVWISTAICNPGTATDSGWGQHVWVRNRYINVSRSPKIRNQQSSLLSVSIIIPDQRSGPQMRGRDSCT